MTKRKETETNSPVDQPNSWRSDGHRRLASLAGSAIEIAQKLGVSKASVTSWRRGDARPGAEVRRSMQEAFGIPVASWDSRAGSEVTPSTAPTPTGPSTPTLGQLRDLLETMEVARREPNLTASELSKLSAEIRHVITAIAAHQRLDRESDQRVRARALELVEPLRGAILELVGHHPDVVTELLDIIDARLARVS